MEKQKIVSEEGVTISREFVRSLLKIGRLQKNSNDEYQLSVRERFVRDGAVVPYSGIYINVNAFTKKAFISRYIDHKEDLLVLLNGQEVVEMILEEYSSRISSEITSEWISEGLDSTNW